jgi:hypothetical protein
VAQSLEQVLLDSILFAHGLVLIVHRSVHYDCHTHNLGASASWHDSEHGNTGLHRGEASDLQVYTFDGAGGHRCSLYFCYHKATVFDHLPNR